uniref:Uncharacterized protein n=1 Tax=Cyanophora sudae TaxID=1522369 RepID=A0A873WUU9_9EUKA|nr:hypothetical protein DXZ12_mgp29 [Cyanophora sudae]QPB15044.1 hypothetical protein [Cyanophora sudae]
MVINYFIRKKIKKFIRKSNNFYFKLRKKIKKIKIKKNIKKIKALCTQFYNRHGNRVKPVCHALIFSLLMVPFYVFCHLYGTIVNLFVTKIVFWPLLHRYKIPSFMSSLVPDIVKDSLNKFFNYFIVNCDDLYEYSGYYYDQVKAVILSNSDGLLELQTKLILAHNKYVLNYVFDSVFFYKPVDHFFMLLLPLFILVTTCRSINYHYSPYVVKAALAGQIDWINLEWSYLQHKTSTRYFIHRYWIEFWKKTIQLYTYAFTKYYAEQPYIIRERTLGIFTFMLLLFCEWMAWPSDYQLHAVPHHSLYYLMYGPAPTVAPYSFYFKEIVEHIIDLGIVYLLMDHIMLGFLRSHKTRVREHLLKRTILRRVYVSLRQKFVRTFPPLISIICFFTICSVYYYYAHEETPEGGMSTLISAYIMAILWVGLFGPPKEDDPEGEKPQKKM